MLRLIAALCCATLLSGCFFLGGGGSGPASYNGYVQRSGMYLASWDVDNSCISPKLQRVIDSFERRFGRKIVVSSGYRDPIRNIIGGGTESSHHMNCEAVDFFIPGVSKSSLIAYAMDNPLVGGLGCYSGRSFIHVDVRDRPRGYRKPVTFSGC
ncbi:D-Ala-D-Ala carboxypeptidase family metallohydrolase [Devosia sp. ZB163]|uniref:YcbK family protein n=1 Tax=Devosia sp. ZB163 TaxID=3025938 RepID=UPI002362A941|nr:D-Ala-D-Ala carboxypeptidase family metallohydrolase [Devosia sp. ZB163]MDC9824347.1 D-Ala-D-Ala carboxypeptidase family metallohydrolase [Devosia sp. ZB163]